MAFISNLITKKNNRPGYVLLQIIYTNSLYASLDIAKELYVIISSGVSLTFFAVTYFSYM